jgi:hypothetical protein
MYGFYSCIFLSIGQISITLVTYFLIMMITCNNASKLHNFLIRLKEHNDTEQNNIKTFSRMTFNVTFSIKTLSIMTISIMTLSITTLSRNDT